MVVATCNESMNQIVVTSSWRERVEDLIGGRKEIVLVAGVAAAAVVMSVVLWSRGSSPAVAPPASAAAPLTSPVPGTSPAGLIYVHVAGAVRRPGLYEFPSGTRVADAVEAAGGPRRGADLDAINLAEILVDGTRLEVPRRDAPAESAPVTSSSAGPSSGTMIDLNTADQTLLETIPGVGPVTAAAILRHRAEIGRFESVEQLLDVSGIGPATLESVRPYVTV